MNVHNDRADLGSVNRSSRTGMCVFSVHNVTKDPPFSRLDLISCRNLMIYMDNDLQDRILRTFHYALNPDGLLFLGLSEGVSRHSNLFAVGIRPPTSSNGRMGMRHSQPFRCRRKRLPPVAPPES